MFTGMSYSQRESFNGFTSSRTESKKQNHPIVKINTPCNLEEIHKEWGDRLIKELQVFTLQEDYNQFKAKEEIVQANPAWHLSTPYERLIYFQKSVIYRPNNKYAPIIPKLTMLIRGTQIHQKENKTEVDWEGVIVPKIISILDEHNLATYWQIPFCFDFHDMRSWAVSVAYDVLTKKIPWHAVVKLIKRKRIHERLSTELDESVEDTDLLISLSTEIDLERSLSEKPVEKKVSFRNSSFCVFCNKKGHTLELCNSKKKKLRQQNIEYIVQQVNLEENLKIIPVSPIYKRVLFSGYDLLGRHSTGSDVNIVDWSVYHDLLERAASFKIKFHEYKIKDLMNGDIPSTCYIEGEVTYKNRYAGVHRFYMIDAENKVPTIFGLTLLRACAQIENAEVEDISAHRKEDIRYRK